MRLDDSPRCPEVRFEEAPRYQTSSVRFHLLEPRLNVAAGAADASRAMVLTSCSKVARMHRNRQRPPSRLYRTRAERLA
jgi:hypothetical protein